MLALVVPHFWPEVALLTLVPAAGEAKWDGMGGVSILVRDLGEDSVTDVKGGAVS